MFCCITFPANLHLIQEFQLNQIRTLKADQSFGRMSVKARIRAINSIERNRGLSMVELCYGPICLIIACFLPDETMFALPKRLAAARVVKILTHRVEQVLEKSNTLKPLASVKRRPNWRFESVSDATTIMDYRAV